MTTFTITLKTRAGISRVKFAARNIVEAKELARLTYGAAVQQVTIAP